MQKKCDQDTLLQRICCAAQTHSIGLTFLVLQKLKDDRPSDGTATGTEGGTVADDLNGVGDRQLTNRTPNTHGFPKRCLKILYHLNIWFRDRIVILEEFAPFH